MPPDATAAALPRGSRLGHTIAQNIGLILACAILILAVFGFALIYGIEQHRLPGNFELTSAVNSAIPLVFAAVGQSFVVLTRGIDLSVGGVVDLANAMAAVTMGKTLGAAAGLFLAASATAGDATTGNSYTLSSIVAVVLGGISLFGGRGSAIGAIAGAFITTLIVNILFFGHVNPLYQSFYEGVFLIIAVVLGGAIGGAIRRRR